MQEYDMLKEKFSLPEFNVLDKEFQLSTIEDDITLREVLKRMESKLDYIAGIFEEILHPAPESITNMHEYQEFSQGDREEMFRMYKQIQFLLRSIMEALIASEDKVQAELINKIADVYPVIKKSALTYVKKMKESWLKDESLEEAERYFG